MTERINKLLDLLNRQNTAFIIFILCIGNFFGLTLETGEEQYFAFARQFADPDWLPHSFTLNHPAGGNLAFQVIIGFFLKYLSFEQMAAWGRIVNFILLAVPLGLISRKLRINNLALVFLLQIVFFGHQSLFAGEWIFKNLEEKSIAYVFVFWSILFLLKERPVLSAVSAALATWFHFLVGGWMFCFVFVYFVVTRRHFKVWLATGLSYAVLTLPLIIYLYKTYFINNPAIVNGVNTNIVYSFWRLKHHVGMFSDPDYFLKNSLTGVALTLLILGLCIFVLRNIKDENIRKVNTLNIIIFSQQFIFMILSVFDQNGVLGKTYPFRTNSISFLLFLFECAMIADKYFVEILKALKREKASKDLHYFEAVRAKLNMFLLLISIAGFLIESGKMLRDLKSYHGDLDDSMISLTCYVKKNSPEDAVFMFVDGDRPYSFMRRAERERFVVVKFTPTKSRTIYEWYTRALIKERMRNDINLIDSVKLAYKLDYLVSDSLYAHPSIILEKQFGEHKLYRVRN